jgi:hypothetical protein
MAPNATIARAVPFVKAVAEDDDLRDHVRRAALAGRAAIVRPAPKPTRMRRAGLALREAGAAMTRAGAKAEARRRARRRSIALRGIMVGGAGAAAAVAMARRSGAAKGEPNV